MRKSKFNLTHLHSTTLDPGYLVPFLMIPTLPNDTFRIGLSSFIRAQPMLAPLMHEVRLFTQYWFVPNRLVWDDWEEFITGGSDLMSTPPFPTITLDADDAKVGSLTDYFGFPRVEGIEVSALPYRAMALIWNERYRDEDLQQPLVIDYGSGEDTTTSRELLSPSFAKDYFTMARPFTQRGGEIAVPVFTGQGGSGVNVAQRIGFRLFTVFRDNTYPNAAQGQNTVCPSSWSKADVENSISQWFVSNYSKLGEYVGNVPPVDTNANFLNFIEAHPEFKVGSPYVMTFDNGTQVVSINLQLYISIESFSRDESSDPFTPGFVSSPVPANLTCPSVGGQVSSNSDTAFGAYSFGNGALIRSVVVPNTGLFSGLGEFINVQVSSQSGFYIRDLRASSALQRYAERSLLYGNRYEEFIMREFGIKPRDARIQRPEYLGGGRGILNISEVLQTAESDDTGVGTMRGHGVAAISQRPIRFRCPEHGIILGLMSIRPKSVYTQGIDREWLKRSRLDFYTPELASIGMQEVLQQELYAQPDNKDKVFGYSQRYQEYRYQKPLVTGEFRDNLSFWNMARIFNNAPELTPEFINMSYSAEDFKRPFQIQDDGAHAFVAMLKNHIRAYRPIPKRAKELLR